MRSLWPEVKLSVFSNYSYILLRAAVNVQAFSVGYEDIRLLGSAARCRRAGRANNAHEDNARDSRVYRGLSEQSGSE